MRLKTPRAPGIKDVPTRRALEKLATNQAFSSQAAGTVFAGPASGSPASPTFRAFDARDTATGTDPLVFANPLTVPTTNGKVMHTVTVTGNSTFNADGTGLGSQWMVLQITNDATPRTITFGTNFDANGNLVGVAGKISTITFMSDGTAWRELSRVVGVL